MSVRSAIFRCSSRSAVVASGANHVPLCFVRYSSPSIQSVEALLPCRPVLPYVGGSRAGVLLRVASQVPGS